MPSCNSSNDVQEIRHCLRELRDRLMMAADRMGFSITAEQEGDVTILALKGDLDMVSAPAFFQLAASYLDHGTRKLLVDLNPLGYIDSRGVYSLLKMLRAIKDARGELFLVVSHERLIRVLSVTGIDKAVRFYPDRSEALARARGSGTHYAESSSATDEPRA